LDADVRDALRSDADRKENTVANLVETRTGTCPTHGTVEATREMPKPGFPYVVYLARKMMAGRRPYRCPDCGTPVSGP
jgi:hypothetical protein